MWLVLLAIYKAIERARSGIVVNGHRLDLLALLIRDKCVPPVLLHGVCLLTLRDPILSHTVSSISWCKS